MNMARRITALLLALLFVIPLAALTSTAASAEDPQPTPEHDVITKIEGFYCLHPHREAPLWYLNLEYEAVPAEKYDGYPQEVLDLVAAAVILQQQYYDETGVAFDYDGLQKIIWQLVCTEPVHIEKLYHLKDNSSSGGAVGEDLAKTVRLAYYNYVKAHVGEVSGHYQMTIWVSPDPLYQDILEAKRIIKHEVPSVEKKVLDHNDTNNAGDAAIGWQDSADYDIGDTIPFQITATLRDLEVFQSYYLEFVDTMEHMTLVENTLTITLDGKDVKDKFTITWDAAGKALTIVCKDVLPLGAVSGTEVVVNYNATLDADANIGREGNANEVYLIYSRSSGTADRGQTPSDKVRVFTYQVTLNKVDENKQPLTGAAFELFKKVPGETAGEYRYVSVGVRGAHLEDGKYVLDSDENTTFLWQGLDDGTYLLQEIITPLAYNTLEPLEFTLTVIHDHKAEDPKIITASCDYKGFSGSNTYYYDSAIAGKFEAQIENHAGTLLPSTGGMGTTMFYVFGSALLLTAACLFLRKRRETI